MLDSELFLFNPILLVLMGNEMEPKEVICPKCGQEQTQTDECVKCGVIISKYTTIQKRKVREKEKLNENIDSIMENTSGQGRSSAVPPGIKGWNWGAFFLSFIWAIGNKTWLGLLTLVPVVCYVMPIKK